jgi:hypothetical protein
MTGSMGMNSAFKVKSLIRKLFRLASELFSAIAVTVLGQSPSTQECGTA